MPLVALAAKLRAIALSEISQMLNETLPYRVQRNFACLRQAQRLHLPHKFQVIVHHDLSLDKFNSIYSPRAIRARENDAMQA